MPSLFFLSWKLTAVLMPTEASTAAINVVGTCAVNDIEQCSGTGRYHQQSTLPSQRRRMVMKIML